MEWITGDIGGTKSALAWMTGDAGALRARFERTYRSADFASADELLRRFIDDAGSAAPPERFLLALPGPVDGQRVSLTNLDWRLDAPAMQARFQLAGVCFVNDFEAAAAGVATLTAADVVALNPQPAEAGGVRVLTGAGTGIGLAFMLAGDDGRCQNFPSEGGHIDFAPANDIQARLLAYLRPLYGHVSWERVASGSAINDLYRFCCIEGGHALPDGRLDGPALVARATENDPAAEAALDLFVDLFGAWVGNVALLFRPRAGVYLAGGLGLHLRDRLQSPRFMAAAVDKGRMRGVVERTPIFLVTCERLGLQGTIALTRQYV
jgi:glucokinase